MKNIKIDYFNHDTKQHEHIYADHWGDFNGQVSKLAQRKKDLVHEIWILDNKLSAMMKFKESVRDMPDDYFSIIRTIVRDEMNVSPSVGKKLEEKRNIN